MCLIVIPSSWEAHSASADSLMRSFSWEANSLHLAKLYITRKHFKKVIKGGALSPCGAGGGGKYLRVRGTFLCFCNCLLCRYGGNNISPGIRTGMQGLRPARLQEGAWEKCVNLYREDHDHERDPRALAMCHTQFWAFYTNWRTKCMQRSQLWRNSQWGSFCRFRNRGRETCMQCQPRGCFSSFLHCQGSWGSSLAPGTRSGLRLGRRSLGPAAGGHQLTWWKCGRRESQEVAKGLASQPARSVLILPDSTPPPPHGF